MKESSDEDDGSESEVDDSEVFKLLKDTMIAKGVKTEKKMAKTAERFVNTPQIKDKNPISRNDVNPAALSSTNNDE